MNIHGGSSWILSLLLVLLFFSHMCHCFYLPGVAPRDFQRVNRIRELPQHNHIVATHTDSPDVLVWDVETQPNRHAVLGATQSRPDLVLTGHKENAEFALAMCPKEPYVLSGGKDRSVVLWSIQDHITTTASDPSSNKPQGSGATIVKQNGESPSVGPHGIFQGHEDTVEDVQFCPKRSKMNIHGGSSWILSLLFVLLFFSHMCHCFYLLGVAPRDFQRKVPYDCNGNSHENNPSSLSCFARYAMESFFREYESFTDSKFLEYMGHKIVVGSETGSASLLNLERHLIGEGSHRRLFSSFRFSVQADLIADFSSQICELIMVERLPSGVFADPFELQHLLHRGVFKDAAVFGDANLELPSFLSNQSIVEVHLDAALNNSAEQEILLEYKVELPLHARYPPLDKSGYSRVRFGAPDLFMYCKMHENSLAQKCSLSTISSSNALELDDIVWSIPAGIKDHSRTVSVVTFTSALLSATSIILVSLRSRQSR